MLYSIQRQKITGPSVRFSCPKCRRVTSGSAYQLADTILLLHFLPLSHSTNTYCVCGDCGTALQSRVEFSDLQRMEGLQIDEFLFYSPSFVYRFLAVTSVLICWAPVVGLVVAAIALYGTHRFQGWPKKFAIFSCVIGSVISVVAIVGLAME
jgi:hypothetical protein